MGRRLLLFLVVVVMHKLAIGQPVGSPAHITKLTEDGKIKEASALLYSETDRFYRQKNVDTLRMFVYPLGQIVLAQKGLEPALKDVQAMVVRIKNMKPSPKTLMKTLDEAAFFYGENGRDKLAYDTYLEELRLKEKHLGKTHDEVAKTHTTLGAHADRMGDIDLSLWHAREALRLRLSSPNMNHESLYFAYNNLGAVLWYASKTDSALHYFRLALNALSKMAPTAENKYYRPAVVNNNLSAIYGQQGNATAAIQAMKLTINNLKLFLATKEPSLKRKTAVTFQFQAIDNLAGIYKELGDVQQAYSLLQYSYGQKQKYVDEHSDELFKSEILLGQALFDLQEYQKAEARLLAGLTRIEAADGENLYWKGDACRTLAAIYSKYKDIPKATHYYEQADSCYAASLEGAYDNIYLELLRDEALFYVKNGKAAKGIAIATKAYNYVTANQKKPTLIGFYHLVNLGEIYYRTGDHKKALQYSDKSLALANRMIRNSTTLLDSVKMELSKPHAIMLRAKANYGLNLKHDTDFLKKTLQELSIALEILDRQKTILQNPENSSAITSGYPELIDFIKEITLELYQKTGNKKYIGQVIGLHESALYSRIRSRIDQMKAVQFAHVPPALLAEEKKLQAAIATSLEGNTNYQQQTNAYFTATDDWQRFQKKLKHEYPGYYNLRYASTFRSLDDYQKNIPPATTVIRYFFTGDNELYALVADSKNATIQSLNSDLLEECLNALAVQQSFPEKQGLLLQQLYQQLWQPLIRYISHKKVTIVPDDALYSLNFELLTPKRITNYGELSTKSLLASHTISYHYSLFIVGADKNTKELSEGFAAFAPGFSDALKDQYTKSVKDSMTRDNMYLSLLPQPFTVSLAQQMQKILGGSLWLNEASTEASFKKHAGNHKIIHIGTHAESNNNRPQYSRLIFAPGDDAKEDNSLFLSEIYNCNLNANLTVLTACESGKAGFSNGEGMVSLAHAFNYAGSESILTGLWKIDEQSSAMIMETFYKKLLDGMDKDEALRQAKLHYLQTCEPRMRAPHYWAGLVLMGDVSAIPLKERRSGFLFVMGGALFCIGIATFVVFFKRKKMKSVA